MRITKTKARDVAHTFAAFAAVASLCLAGCSQGSGSGSGGGGAVSAGSTSANVGSLQSIRVDPSGPLTVDTGMNSAFQIIVTGVYSRAELDRTRDATYVVEDTAIVQISGDGLITPVAEGTTNIAVNFSGRTETIAVTVVAPTSTQPVYTDLTIYPPTRNLPLVNNATGVEQYQQLAVIATDDTGRKWDFTRSVPIGIYDANNAVTLDARVTNSGLLRAIVNGEVIAVSRIPFSTLIFGAHFVLGDGPDATPVDSSTLYSGGALAASSNPIDVAVLEGLFGQLIEPANTSTDGEFLRRLYADALGRTPTAAEAEAFSASNAVGKRAAEVDQVLADAAFAAKWAGHMGEWFTMQRNTNAAGMNMAANAAAFDAWAGAGIAAGTSLKAMVSELAQGSVPSFETQHDNAAKKVDILVLAGAGMTAKCAVCHDHPLTGLTDVLKWNQVERYGLDAFFATNNSEAIPLDKFGIRSGNGGVAVQPGQGGFALDATAAVTSTLATDIQIRRDEFAALFTNSAAFDRGMGHRIFAQVTVELLNPNQFLEKNVGAVLVPSVLDALATAFSQDSSLKGFLRAVLTSEFYGLSSAYTDTLADALLARRPLRRHHAEVMDAAVAGLTGASISGGDADFFNQVFGYPFNRESAGERVESVNMSQSFLLMNSPVVQDRVSSGTGQVADLANQVGANTITTTDAIQFLFTTALSRPANATELADATTTVTTAPSTREGLEDVAAVLMSTTEFVMR